MARTKDLRAGLPAHHAIGRDFGPGAVLASVLPARRLNCSAARSLSDAEMLTMADGVGTGWVSLALITFPYDTIDTTITTE